ncbi:Protein TBC-1, partial [Aphelenchoides avenae]
MDWDQLYNLKNQAELRRDCRALLEELPGCSLMVPQIESLVTLYCKKRKLEYEKDNGWLSIIGKLLQLPFEQSTLWNIFYAITTKFVPRLEKSSKVFDLFRLILQYHDPELCTWLDSVKVQPQQYAKDWFSTLLSKDTSAELCWVIWDHYFEKGEPFLIFFVALAFVMSARDDVIGNKDAQKIRERLANAPSNMAMDDVADLLEVCYVHLNITPVSIREDFHCMLFGSNLVDEYSDLPLNRIMCLPISVQELYKRAIETSVPSNAMYTYFVIDTRSKKDFNAGCVQGSYNLNG